MTEPLPTYDEVVASYPSDVPLCFTEATVVAEVPDAWWTVELAGGTVVYAQLKVELTVMEEVEAEFPCWGMQLFTEVPLEIGGSDVPAGSTLAVSADSDPAAFGPVTLSCSPQCPLVAAAGDYAMLIGDPSARKIKWSRPDGVVLVAVAP